MKMLRVTIAILVAVLMSGAAQAVTVFKNEDTRFDVYGRLYIFVMDTDEQSIEGDGSRFGFRTQTKVHDGLSVFANAEFHYDSSNSGNQPFNIRNNYVGVEGDFGRLLIGNFDSVYFQAVSKAFDLYEQEGFVAMGRGPSGARADSVAYFSPDLNGLTLMGQLRQYPKVGVVDEQYVLQLSAQYKLPNLTLGLGVIDGNKKTLNADTQNTLVGLSAVYSLSKELSVLAMVENQKGRGTSDDHFSLGLTYDFGEGSVYGTLGRDWNEDNYFAFGVSWQFSRPMSVFAEYGHGDIMPAGTSSSVTTLGVRYNF